LLDALWPDVFVADGALKACILEIRRALGDDAHTPRFIETAHRRGYRFIGDVSRIRCCRRRLRPRTRRRRPCRTGRSSTRAAAT
jgi:DNA-binding winged-HTH domains